MLSCFLYQLPNKSIRYLSLASFQLQYHMKKFKSTARGASIGYVQNNAHVVCNFIDQTIKISREANV